MLISIIIPVYNSEKYLARCLDSVLSSLSSAKCKGEIIAVDNASIDNSKKILAEFHKRYPAIVKLFDCQKAGASAARNYGASQASGDYIWFIDADDTIAEAAIDKLLAVAKSEKADLVMMGMQRIYSNGKTDYLSAVNPKVTNYKSRFVRYGLGPVQVLIRRKWWNENHFLFHEGIIHEDMELMSSLILFTENFASIDEPFYYYYQNPDSVLHKATWDRHYFDIFPALNSLYQKFVDKKATKKYYAELEWFFIWNLLIDSAKDFKKFPEGHSGLKRSRQMMRKYFPHWRRNKFLKQKSLKLQARVRLNYWGL